MREVDLSRELEIARDLARRAGKIILRHYAGDFAVDYKDRQAADPVTQADRDANAAIVEGLARSFPDDGILAEESAPQADRHERRRLWCVDPLDGTREFVEKNGQFAVMIGLAIDAEARLGVVYRPTEDLLYWGASGRAGLERAGEVSTLSVTETHVPAEATMMVSRSHLSQTVTAVAEQLGILRVRPLGSVGLKIAELAEARADLYVSTSTRTHEWDACAPEAILRAAGGVMTDVCGQPLRYNKPTTETPRGMLATNGRLHQACVEVLRPVAEARGWH